MKSAREWAKEVRKAKRQSKAATWKLPPNPASAFSLNRLLAVDRKRGNAIAIGELDRLRQQRLSVLGYSDKHATPKQDDTSTGTTEQSPTGSTLAGTRQGFDGSNRTGLVHPRRREKSC